MTDTAQKLLDFSKFITLLTGEMGVDVTTSDHPRQGALVLPALDGLSDEDLDVLYGLCVREVGHLARSKKTMSDVAELTTARALRAATLVEQARVERFLCKSLGGAKEILDEHFGSHAFNARYQHAILGTAAADASMDDVFLYALKWHLSGRPRWNWETLFPASSWNKAVEFLDTNPVWISSPLRKFSDSVALSRQALSSWLEYCGHLDDSQLRPKSAQEASWEKSLEKIKTSVSQLAEQRQSTIDALLDKSQQHSDNANKLETLNAPQWQNDTNLAQHLQSDLSRAMSVESIVDRLKDSAKEEARALKEFQKMDKAVAKQQAKASSAPSSASTRKQQALSEKMSDIQERLEEQLRKLDQQLAAQHSKELDLVSKLQNPKLTPSQQDRLNERMAQVSDRMEELARAKEEAANNAAQKIDELTTKMEKVSQISSFAAQQQQQRIDDLHEKMMQRDQAAAQWSALHERSNMLRDSLSNEMQSQGLPISDAEQWKEHVSQLRQQLHDAQMRLSAGQSQVRSLRDQAKDFSRQARDLSRQAQWEVQQQLQKVEEELASQGIEVSLTDKMEVMEGWDQANAVQSQFDAKASQELKMSVVNGCGGGRGTRDMMVQINQALSQITEVDPNNIFKDVAHSSPLSSWPSVKKVGSGPSASSISDARSHLVWSRQYDRVINAPRRPAELVKLRQQYKKEIAAVRALFLKHWRPSFKPKFIGGREEGDLDSRNLWKLASGQDNDFFEVVKKRPNFQSCATILVDVSGSCASWADSPEEAAVAIQGMVLLLSEGLSAVNIPHEILTYCAPVDDNLSSQHIPEVYNRKSCRLDTMVIKSFKDKDCSAVPSIAIEQADNSDGESVRIALRRLLKQSPRQKMMFVISDGKPFMQDADSDLLDADLYAALQECAKNNVTVAGLGMANAHPVLGTSYWTIPAVSELPNVLSKEFFSSVKS